MRNPTTGIMVNAGIFVNIANPKNMPESKIGIRLLLSSSLVPCGSKMKRVGS
ncbi:MAG: hypothetical protein WCF03_20570 [Nitrososphaeraceae archaeon]